MQLSLISEVGSDATITKSSGDTQVCHLILALDVRRRTLKYILLTEIVKIKDVLNNTWTCVYKNTF